jgi:hypothetical protein
MQAEQRERAEADPRAGNHWAGTVGAVLVAGVVLLFLPLAIAAFEYFVFGSDHFEDGLRKLGVHDALSAVYKPCVKAIRWVIRRFRP